MRVHINFTVNVDPELWNKTLGDLNMPINESRQDVKTWARSLIVGELENEGVLV